MATHCPNLVCDTPGLWKGFDNLYYLVLATAGAVKSIQVFCHGRQTCRRPQEQKLEGRRSLDNHVLVLGPGLRQSSEQAEMRKKNAVGIDSLLLLIRNDQNGSRAN